MTGVFTINYPATMAVIDRMTKLVEKLTRINERYESEISTLSRCRGTTENPHNHDTQIAAYRKIISNNSKDIVDLGLLISQIFSLMINTKMTDFYLTQLIKNMMSGDSNVPNPETSVMGESLSEQAAAKAGVRVDSRGVPIINNGTDAKAYMEALNEVMKQQPQIISNEHGSYYMKDGVPIFKTLSVPNNQSGGRSNAAHSGYLSEDIQIYIHDICIKNNVDYYLVLGTILHESGCDSNAGSINAASGYMQLVPSTWSAYTNPEYIPPWSSNNDGSKAAVARHKDLYDYIIAEYGADFKNKNDPYANIAVGVASYKDWSNSYDNMIDIVQHYGEGSKTNYNTIVSSTSEILYYRDILALQAGDPAEFIGILYTNDGYSLVTNFDPVTGQYIPPQSKG